jgi:hypothetical protein
VTLQEHQQHPPNHIHRQHARIEDLQVLHNLLELRRDVDGDVVVEAGLHAELVRQRRPIVSSNAIRVAVPQQFSFSTLQLRCFPLEFLLAPLKWVKVKKKLFKG